MLCFNASNPVIRGLLVSQDIELARETAILLYVQALLLSQQPLTTDETSGFSNALARVLAKANKATNDDTSS